MHQRRIPRCNASCNQGTVSTKSTTCVTQYWMHMPVSFDNDPTRAAQHSSWLYGLHQSLCSVSQSRRPGKPICSPQSCTRCPQSHHRPAAFITPILTLRLSARGSDLGLGALGLLLADDVAPGPSGRRLGLGCLLLALGCLLLLLAGGNGGLAGGGASLGALRPALLENL